MNGEEWAVIKEDYAALLEEAIRALIESNQDWRMNATDEQEAIVEQALKEISNNQ